MQVDSEQPNDAPANAGIPQPLVETLEWLISREEFTASRALLASLAKVLSPSDPVASDFLAAGLHRSKSYREAAAQAMHTLSLIPDSVDAKFNAAKCCSAAGLPIDAEFLMSQVTASRPDWIDPQIDLAVYIAAQGRVDEAMELLESILPRVAPSDRNLLVVKFNLGWHYMRTGRFKEGMRYLGLGRQLRIWGAMTRDYPRPRLEPGLSVAGKTILLSGEGGAGDEIINARFAQVIKARGGRCYWIPQAPLAALMGQVNGIERVMSYQDCLAGAYDYWAPCMDLPRILDLDEHEIPNGPYLTADPWYVEKWRSRIPRRDGRLRVGLRWQGNALYDQDLMRSVPFALLAKLTAIPNIDFYSLQRDEGTEELPTDSPVVDLSSQLETWQDTAGAIAHLDLVISSCTSVPHLAAAMGKPTWILCTINPYYLWCIPGDRSPWYQSVTLFRQRRFGSWDEPFKSLEAQLRQLAAPRALGAVRGVSEATP